VCLTLAESHVLGTFLSTLTFSFISAFYFSLFSYFMIPSFRFLVSSKTPDYASFSSFFYRWFYRVLSPLNCEARVLSSDTTSMNSMDLRF
jgi:hypothetical protein